VYQVLENHGFQEHSSPEILKDGPKYLRMTPEADQVARQKLAELTVVSSWTDATLPL
jgi:hypothetical protein